MLENLYIKNFVLIDECSLDLKEGFSAFTGETGAGKSVLMDAIGLLCGERASSAQIRTGADKSFIEGTFTPDEALKRDFEELGFDDDVYTVTREFDRSGKNVCRLNHRVVNLSLLKETVGKYIDIHSQNERQYLLDPKYHLYLLDTYANDKNLLEIVKEVYEKYAEKKEAYDTLKNSVYSEEAAEFLKYRFREIDEANLKEGEEEELEERIKVLSSYEKIFNAVSGAVQLLDADEGPLSKLYDASKSLGSVRGIRELEELSDALDNQYYEVQDITERAKSYLSSMEMDEGELDRLNERVYKINALKRKYGPSFEDVLRKKEEFAEELRAMEHKDDVLSDYEKELKKLREAYDKAAGELSLKRKEAAAKLEKEIVRELKELQLKNARFEVHFDTSEPSSNGTDKVVFMISMNPGEPVRPLHKTASGGELSRLMLGLKTVFTSLWGSEVIVFDEIDAGVSGSVALSIGKKMRKISGKAQVFSVTHLAPVAAYAEYQYKVAKHVKNGETFTEIRLLNHEERLEELALINTGSVTPASYEAAKELWESVKDE